MSEPEITVEQIDDDCWRCTVTHADGRLVRCDQPTRAWVEFAAEIIADRMMGRRKDLEDPSGFPRLRAGGSGRGAQLRAGGSDRADHLPVETTKQTDTASNCFHWWHVSGKKPNGHLTFWCRKCGKVDS